MSDEIDFTEDLKAGDINRVINKAREFWVLGQNVKKLDFELKEAKAKHSHMQREELPTVMREETPADELPFDNDYCLKLSPLIAGDLPSSSSISKEKDAEQKELKIQRREDGFEWLRKNNAGSLISHCLQIDIPKSKEGLEKVRKIEVLALELGLMCSRDESVHYQTLNSFIKERLKLEGEQVIEDDHCIPHDVFNIFIGTQAKIVPPKK